MEIAELDRDRTALNAIASREKPPASLSLKMLVDAFAPSVEFDLLNRDDKRVAEYDHALDYRFRLSRAGDVYRSRSKPYG